MRKIRNRRGQGLVEYIIIVAAVAMIALTSLSMFGHKVADNYAVASGMLPGAHAEDNAPISTGFFAGVGEDASGNVVGNAQVGWGDIIGQTNNQELNNNVIASGTNNAAAFVAEDE